MFVWLGRRINYALQIQYMANVVQVNSTLIIRSFVKQMPKHHDVQGATGNIFDEQISINE